MLGSLQFFFFPEEHFSETIYSIFINVIIVIMGFF